jgi:hypothetical protein
MHPTLFRLVAASTLTVLAACSRSSEPTTARDASALSGAAASAELVESSTDAVTQGIVGGGTAAREQAQSRARAGNAAGKVAASAAPTAAEPPPPAPAAPPVPPNRAGASGAPGTGTTADAPLVIRMGSASLQVDSVDGGVARVRAVVASIPGAYVANMSFEGGREQAPRATLEVKVPAASFDRLVAGLTPVGKVESVSVSAEDVSEEFVDLTARATNARRLEARLVELLATRTGRLTDVLAVERELARVREEVERYDGRLRFLRTRAAMSTLSITVHEPLPVLGTGRAANPIAEAFREGWRNFVGFVATLIAISGVAIPLALLAYAGWRLVRRVQRPAEAR